MTLTTAHAARARYANDAVTTASPARLLIMLYDRLVRDLLTAEQAIENGQTAAAHEQLVHAQRIVSELAASLDPTVWDGGPALAQIYDFLLRELVATNVSKDAARARACREIVEPLRDSWRQAAMATASP